MASPASAACLLGDLLRDGRRRLGVTAFAPPREGALLLGAGLGLSEARVRARDAQRVPPAAAARFEALLARRLGGEPVAYLLGERELYGRSLAGDQRRLLPPPHT